ncbi:uncharacterized protein LOC117316389 [Pecten maximus]|uniref:uncharacterized protein LOC117316389 n=1 Tax=Pecten maximus TaxID=6579 RepID=UPI00145871EA|nr:uncharacterized protein LOC117316389 [Pecten maximus]
MMSDSEDSDVPGVELDMSMTIKMIKLELVIPVPTTTHVVTATRVVMPTEVECLCCQEVSLIQTKTEDKAIACITQHDGFIANCINTDVLEVSMFEYAEHHGPIGDNQPMHE